MKSRILYLSVGAIGALLAFRADGIHQLEELELQAPQSAALDSGKADGAEATGSVHGAQQQPGPERDIYRECQTEWQELVQAPALPGAVAFDRVRAELLPRAKNEPVVFVRTPTASDDANRVAKAYRERLVTTPHAWNHLRRYVAQFQRQPELGRQTLLREGYLYAETPELAHALVQQVRLEHLFDAPQVWIQRGEVVEWARRDANKGYVYEEGQRAGTAVSLLLLDRIGVGEPPEPLHLDVRSLRYREHFDRIQVERVSEAGVLAKLQFGEIEVPTILDRDGARLSIRCKLVEPEWRAEYETRRDENRRHQRVMQALRAAMRLQIEEELPFDEPRNEIGQQDGMLRLAWRWAYLEGRRTYKFNDDRYRVYDQSGRPQPPQVCVDFLTDTFERASGTWWRPQGANPGRNVGRLNFKEVDGFVLRRAPALINFARENPDWFELYTVPLREQIAIGHKPRFFAKLARMSHLFRSGDILFIRGYTPWDEDEMHSHTFFIYETDPVTGTPISIAGNAGSPSLRTLEVEARRTPHRTLWYRLRPRLAWLESIIPDDYPLSTEPPPLTNPSD